MEACARCAGLEDVLSLLREKKNDEELTPQMMERLQQYWDLSKDPDYQQVDFNEANGGIIASHIGHHFDKVGGKYEKEVMTAGYNSGHVVIMGDERSKSSKHTEGTWDGKLFEVSGRETASENNILKGLKHCANKRDTQIAILDFPNGGFNLDTIKSALIRFNGLSKLNDGQYLKFEKIICVQNEEIVYEINL